MSIEQLVAYVHDCSGSHAEHLPAYVGEQIIAALRAAYEVTSNSLNIYEILKEAGHYRVAEEFKIACLAWDAVTEEDV